MKNCGLGLQFFSLKGKGKDSGVWMDKTGSSTNRFMESLRLRNLRFQFCPKTVNLLYILPKLNWFRFSII